MQARHGRKSRFLHVLKSGFEGHLVTNSEQSSSKKLLEADIATMKLSRSNSQISRRKKAYDTLLLLMLGNGHFAA